MNTSTCDIKNNIKKNIFLNKNNMYIILVSISTVKIIYFLSVLKK